MIEKQEQLTLDYDHERYAIWNQRDGLQIILHERVPTYRPKNLMGPVVVKTPADILPVVRPMMKLADEVFAVIPLDSKYQVISPGILTMGTMDLSLVNKQKLFYHLISVYAHAFMLVHNHPTGDPLPSGPDISITRNIVEASRIMGITILDHIIVTDYDLPEGHRSNGGEWYCSIRESGLCAFN